MSEKTDLVKYKKLVLLAGIGSLSTAIIFLIVKIVVWMMTSSSAIFASLTDSLFDALASLVNLLALRFSLMPPDKTHRYGHHKLQALASLAQAAFIGGSSALLIAHGIKKALNPDPVAYMDIAIGVSVFTTACTVLLICLQSYVYKKTKSEAIAADRLHYSSDVMLNLGVIVALILSYYGYLWADGLFAALIGVFILLGVYKIAYNAVQTLLDKSLEPEEIAELLKLIIKVPEVKSVHDLKTHRAGPIVFIQGHLVLDKDMRLEIAHELVDLVEKNILSKYPDAEINLHMEPDIKTTYDYVQFNDREEILDNGKSSLVTDCIHHN